MLYFTSRHRSSLVTVRAAARPHGPEGGTTVRMGPTTGVGSEAGGGGARVRTEDLLRARQALSQLSYTPRLGWWAHLDSNQGPQPYQGCALTN